MMLSRLKACLRTDRGLVFSSKEFMAKVLVGHKSTNKLIFEYLARFSSTDLTFMCRLAKILV